MKETCGKWTSANPILSYAHQFLTITAHGSNGRIICAEIEDVRSAIQKIDSLC